MRRCLPLVLGLFVTDFAPTQEQGTAVTETSQRQIVVQNLSPFARREWVRVVVPFARGAVTELPDLHVGKGPTVWQPIGARWDDGSLRQALCLFPMEMKRMSEVKLALEKGGGTAISKIAVIDPVRTGAAKVEIKITQAGKTTTATPVFVRELETNAARRVSLFRCRIGNTGLLFELIVSSCAGQPHYYANIALFHSDPTTKSLQARVDKAVVTTTRMRFVFRNTAQFGMKTKFLGGGSETTLLENAVLGDGQGIRRAGVLVPRLDGKGLLRDHTLEAAAIVPILAAMSWRGTGAYGPFGVVPEAPPWLRGNLGRQALARRHSAFVRRGRQRGDPFKRFPFSLVKDPGATGGQADFGLLKLSPVASTGLPSFLLEVEPSVLQEACRPVHVFESDGTPVQSRNHRDWVQWDGRTHWNCDVSKDRLGKPCPVPRFPSNGWKGKDRQHWSSNYLCGYYLLTGSHWALREIENEVQLFLAGQTLRGGIGTSGPGAPRAAGRMLLLGCWLYQCTGDEALVKRMKARMEMSYLKMWAGRKLGEDKVRPLMIRRATEGSLGGKVRFWTPWEECIGVTGFVAFHRLTGNEIARSLAEEISLNALRHGWLIDRSGAHVGYEVRFQNGGKPLTRKQMLAREKTVCSWAGGGIGVWSMAAVQVALHFAKARDDKAMIEKAERILSILRRNRDRPPRDGWWDEYREWDALSIGR
jgi:hypothetical protein